MIWIWMCMLWGERVEREMEKKHTNEENERIGNIKFSFYWYSANDVEDERYDTLSS